MPDDADVRLQVAISRLLRWATRPGSIEDRAGPAAAGLTATDLWLLDGVTRYGPVRSSDLASWQGVDRSTITVQLRRLEERGLVVRAPDPQDGRVALLSASAVGQQLWAAVDGYGSQVVADLTDGWADADRMCLAQLLERFTTGMDTELPRR